MNDSMIKKVGYYSRLLKNAQRVGAGHKTITKLAFLYHWAMWKARQDNANWLVNCEAIPRQRMNKLTREAGHRAAFHHSQLQRMGETL